MKYSISRMNRIALSAVLIVAAISLSGHTCFAQAESAKEEDFIKIIDDSIPYLNLVLSSKTQHDTKETVRVLTLLYQFGINSASTGIKKMLNLIFAKEEKIQVCVLNSF